MADKMHMVHDLPFPNLIDWESIALFTEDLHTISQVGVGCRVQGVRCRVWDMGCIDRGSAHDLTVWKTL